MLFTRHLVFAAALIATSASAQQFIAGDIVVERPWARATPKGASVAVGYMVLRNNGGTADALTAIASPAAGSIEMHESKTDAGVTRMGAIAALAIPPGGAIVLRPGADHIMFVDLKSPLKQGASFKAILTFEHAGKVEVAFAVEGVGAAAPGMDMK